MLATLRITTMGHLRDVMRKAPVLQSGDISESPDLSGREILISYDAGH
jgi:hypothetical protein